MTRIFEHEDTDGDELKVERGSLHPEMVVFTATQYEDPSRFAQVGLSHDRVRALRDALTEYLGEDKMAPAPVTSWLLTFEAVRDMIAGAIAGEMSVRPLHQSPQAAVTTDTGQSLCVRPGCGEFGLGAHLEHDLPRDVQPPTSSTCADCGHGQRDHGDGFCWGDRPVACTCSLFVAKTPKPVALPHCTRESGGCRHSWNRHTDSGCTVQTMVDRKARECGCTRTRGAQ